MKTWLITQAAGLMAPLVIGPLAFIITQWLKRSIAALDATSPRVKQAFVIALSFVLAGAVKVVGDYLPPVCGTDAPLTCLDQIADPQAMQVMLSALFAFALHAAKQKEREKT